MASIEARCDAHECPRAAPDYLAWQPLWTAQRPRHPLLRARTTTPTYRMLGFLWTERHVRAQHCTPRLSTADAVDSRRICAAGLLSFAHRAMVGRRCHAAQHVQPPRFDGWRCERCSLPHQPSPPPPHPQASSQSAPAHHFAPGPVCPQMTNCILQWHTRKRTDPHVRSTPAFAYLGTFPI